MAQDLEKIEITSRKELRQWLKKNHTQTESVWLVTYKKSVPSKHVTYDEVAEEVICFGWIDSLPRSLDQERSMLRLSPRKLSSAWSKANKIRSDKMIQQKKMTAAGLEKVKWAKKPETRMARIQDTVEKAAQKIRANHYRQPGAKAK